MSGYFELNGSVKKISGIYANVNGTVKKIVSGYANINGAVKKIYGEDGSGYLWVQGGGSATSSKYIYVSEKSTLQEAFTRTTPTIAYDKLQPFDDVYGYFGCVYTGTRFVMYCGDGQFIQSEKGRTWTKLPVVEDFVTGSSMTDSQKNMLFSRTVPITDGSGVGILYSGRYYYYLPNGSTTWQKIDLWQWTTESYSFAQSCCYYTENPDKGCITAMLIKKDSDWAETSTTLRKGHVCFIELKQGSSINFFEYNDLKFYFALESSSVTNINIFYDSVTKNYYVSGRNVNVSGSPSQTYSFKTLENTLTSVDASHGSLYPFAVSTNNQINYSNYRKLKTTSGSVYNAIWEVYKYSGMFVSEVGHDKKTSSDGYASTIKYFDVGFCYKVKDLILWNLTPNDQNGPSSNSDKNYYFYDLTNERVISTYDTDYSFGSNMFLYPTRVGYGKVRDE